MRRLWLRRAAGLCLAPLVGLGVVFGSELTSSPATPAVPPPVTPAAKPAKPIKPAPKKEEASCGDCGTSVEFADTPVEAAAKAKKEQKLVFVLHVSGNFEDPRFT